AAVQVVAEQRRAGLQPVVVVSAFEGVTDTILSSASVLLPDGGQSLREPRQAPDSPLARETDRALATGEALSAALFALGLQARGIRARSFSGAEAGIRTAAAHLGAEVRRVYSRPLRTALAEELVPVVAGFQGIGSRGELRLVVRALDANQPMTEVQPNLSRTGGDPGPMMLAVDRKERIARISLVGPAERMPEILPLPASAEGSFDEGGLRVVWSEVP